MRDCIAAAHPSYLLCAGLKRCTAVINKQGLTLSAARGRALTLLSSSLVLRGAWSHTKLYSIYTTHTHKKKVQKPVRRLLQCCVTVLRQRDLRGTRDSCDHCPIPSRSCPEGAVEGRRKSHLKGCKGCMRMQTSAEGPSYKMISTL